MDSSVERVIEVSGSVAMVTGGGNGIGRALVRNLARRQIAVGVVDVDAPSADATANELLEEGLPAVSVKADVTKPSDMAYAAETIAAQLGPIDVLCASAGIGAPGGLDAGDDQWEREWNVNLMGSVRAARAVVPGMLPRGKGYVLFVASGAGLTMNPEALCYTASKHAVVGVAKWLAARYRDAGIKVSCFCPLGVLTRMFEDGLSPALREYLRPSAVEPDTAAQMALDGLFEGRLVSSTDPRALDEFAACATDPDAWLVSATRRARKLPGTDIRPELHQAAGNIWLSIHPRS